MGSDGEPLLRAHSRDELIEATETEVRKTVAALAVEPVPMLRHMQYVVALRPVFAAVQNERVQVTFLFKIVQCPVNRGGIEFPLKCSAELTSRDRFLRLRDSLQHMSPRLGHGSPLFS